MKKHISTFLKLLLAMFVFSAAFLFLLAFLLYKFRLSESVVAAVIVSIYVISTFLGGFLAGKIVKQKKYIWGFILGAAYYLVLFAVSAAMKQEGGVLNPESLWTAFLCMAGGMLGGMLS